MSPDRVFDIVAVICFAVCAIPWWGSPPAEPYRTHLVALGLVFFVLAHMVAGVSVH